MASSYIIGWLYDLVGSMTLSPLHLQLVCGECTGTVVLWQRVGWPKHKALLAHRKCLEVPDPLDGSERGQERCLSRQEFQLDWVQQLKGTPLKSSKDDVKYEK